MEEIVYGELRVQLLSEEVVRIERAGKKGFCDRDTFFIPDRAQYADSKIAYSQEEGVICFGEYELYLPEGGSSLAGVKLEKNGQRVYTYRKQQNSGELPSLDKTPEVFAIADSPRIFLPEGGYSADRKGEYSVEENAQDVYLLLCGKDYKKLRRLYVELTGRSEFVRLSTLGGWESKYYAYTEEEARQLILDYEKYNIPLDNMVIDTDWRDCAEGWGYDVNKKLFPDMKRFLSFAHEHGVEVMFNDHPEPVAGTKSVFDGPEIAYREKNLQALMELGLDTWWYDRNWSTHLLSASENVYWETLGLYLFTDITRHFYQKQAGDNEVYRRPVIMGNVVNVANGCYQGIKDTASHRYSIQWTGDTFCDADSLAREVATMLKASENGIAYVNSDCGGHIGDPEKELFIRWMQFGTLSPVFRPHCTNNVKRTRDPWVYDEETLNIVREYNDLRYRLLPAIYKAAHENYETGAPIFRRLGWNYPKDKRAVKCDDEYMLDDLLIKPVAGKHSLPVPKANYTSPVQATYYAGRECEGEPLAKAQYPMLDKMWNRRSPEKGVPVYEFSARFEAEVLFERDVRLVIRCDDGATVYVDGEKVFEDKGVHSAMSYLLNVVEGGKKHKVVIEYFQAGGEAAIGLYYKELDRGDKVPVYLPEGRWLDTFDGKVYTGGKTVFKQYALREMPLFVRLGAVVPLAHEAKNTKEQKWDRLVFDYYPDRNAAEEGLLYEDDGETTAYKGGAYRTTKYGARYEEGENAFVVTLDAAKGAFAGERACTEREISVKFHCVKGVGRPKKITVNGEEAGFVRSRKRAGAFPLNAGKTAPDSDTVFVTFRTDVTKAYTVKFYF